ncbi:helix-turn-helix domain-containing protein [Tepidimonas charontis]|uniref:MarR family protein n=1 Tax=Tepidimonas charontis TaxID=2267262 RepID=A0A554XCA3_9BURK|nr:MarR family transcriptional regulator [Tepidimonas charontis]TSE33482.1 MarR family protein [Tepidimonas charontis]
MRLARKTDPATSHEAARRTAEFAGSQRARILAMLRFHGPLTPEQLGAELGVEPYAIRKRLPELQKAGLAMPTGEVKPTRSGRHQRVWRAI